MENETDSQEAIVYDTGQWRLNAISVTKYDPQYRNSLGHFMREDWTDISDIGEIYNDEKVTRSQYNRVEDAYVKSARMFLASIGCRFVVVEWVENHIEGRDHLSHTHYAELAQKFKLLASGQRFAVDDVDDLVRAILRSVLWCKITCEGSEAAIHFGYDLYMYFYPAQLPDSLVTEIEALGLFVY